METVRMYIIVFRIVFMELYLNNPLVLAEILESFLMMLQYNKLNII